MKGESYGRRFVDRPPVLTRFTADPHAADLTDHEKHIGDIRRAHGCGFPYYPEKSK